MSKLCFEFSYKCLNFCVYKGSPSNLSSALVYVPLRVLELKWRENVAKVQCSAAFLTESHSAWARVMTKVTAQASIAIVQNRYIFVLCVMKSRKEKKGFTLYGSIGHSGRWAQQRYFFPHPFIWTSRFSNKKVRNRKNYPLLLYQI